MRFYIISSVTICLCFLFAASAHGLKEYQGNIGDKNVSFLLAWEDSGEVSGKCRLENGHSIPIEGKNYAEGKLKLILGEANNPIGFIDLSKATTGGAVIWSGISEFNDGSRHTVSMFRVSNNSRTSESLSRTTDGIDRDLSNLKKTYESQSQEATDFNLNNNDLLQDAQRINQEDELEAASYSNYVGTIGESRATVDLFWCSNEIVVGTLTFEKENPTLQQDKRVLTLIGTNKNPGEVVLLGFNGGNKLASFILRKEKNSKPIIWKGSCDTAQGIDSVILVHQDYANDLDRFSEFSGDLKKIGTYALWIGNSKVPFEHLYPIGEINLKNTGDAKNPTISFKEDLPEDIASGLIAYKDKLIVVSHGSTVTAFDIITGGKVWSINFPFSDINLHLSCEGNSIFLVGGYGNELINTVSIWELPIYGNGKCIELFRTWLQGSEGSLPVRGSLLSRIPNSDKFLIKMEDSRVGEINVKNACAPTLLIFNAEDRNLYKIPAGSPLLSQSVDYKTENGVELATHSIRGGAIQLVKNDKTIDLVANINAKKISFDNGTFHHMKAVFIHLNALHIFSGINS